MERINIIKKNLVYPERIDITAQMKGPKVAGGDGPPSDQWGTTPKSAWDDAGSKNNIPRTKTAESSRRRNSEMTDQSRQSKTPPAIKRLPETEPLNDSQPELNGAVRDRMTELLRRFAERTARARARLEMPPSPQHEPGSEAPPEQEKQKKEEVKEKQEKPPVIVEAEPSSNDKQCWDWGDHDACSPTVDPHGILYLVWLSIITFCYAYNAAMIPFRWSFPYQTPSNTPIWLTIDSIFDVLYLIDVAVVKPRLSYLSEGFWVQDPVDTRRNYIKKLTFKMDLISLFPLEVLYLYFGTQAVWLRIPRLFKFQTVMEFYASMDRVLSSPFIVRIGRTLLYMFYLIHLKACAYYAVSKWEGIGSNGWVYSGVGNAYVRSFYFATKCATSIGKNAKPENNFEFAFMTVAWLMGVFVIALMIGQIRDIIATATKTTTEYLKLVDDTKEYIKRQNLPKEMIFRATSWFNFTWEQQHTLDESTITNALQKNLKTDVAISVHIQTLNKVQLFNDCDEALLRDLVLKLKPVIYLPGDLVCRKGDVGKEMYIIKLGQVQVMGGPNNDVVLATLSEGSVFGEISLLGIGADRRTANVMSKGFSNLFVLNKNDLNSALVFYPEAQEMLRQKARNLIKKNQQREEENPEKDVIIRTSVTPTKPLRLLEAAMKVIPKKSGAGKLLRQGSLGLEKSDTSSCSSDEGLGNDCVVSVEMNHASSDENSEYSCKSRSGDSKRYREDGSECFCDKIRQKTEKSMRRRRRPDNGHVNNVYSIRPTNSDPHMKPDKNNHNSPRKCDKE